MTILISDVLQMAIDHPKYLCKAPGGEAWLCKVVYCLADENKITEEDAEKATDVIHDSLSGCAFLRSKLRMDKIINDDVFAFDDEYKVAAMNFWRTLITDLKKKGV